MMGTDLGLHVAVRDALRAELGAAATDIIVKTQDGVVSLSGVVRTPAQKLAAERVVQRVTGVHAIVQALKVQSEEKTLDTDEGLAQRALAALANGEHPIGRDVTIEVEKGWLTLRGTVGSETEFSAVERALECLSGVRGMTSEVQIAGAGARGSGSRVAPSTV